jgi:hypothetical protein
MEMVRGYFTVERNIVGLTLREMEDALGFRPGRLASGARVLVLQKQPIVGQFVFAGSTRYSDAEGLVPIEQRSEFPIPHAWLNQRLVKIDPNLAHTRGEEYPQAKSPVEQWELVVRVPADEVCRLTAGQAYWPRG